jgi:hypothetical protein
MLPCRSSNVYFDGTLVLPEPSLREQRQAQIDGVLSENAPTNEFNELPRLSNDVIVTRRVSTCLRVLLTAVRRQNRMLSFDQQLGACLQRAQVTALRHVTAVSSCWNRSSRSSRLSASSSAVGATQPWRYSPFDSRSQSSEATAASSKLSGSAVLGYSAPLVSLRRTLRYRQVQDRRRLASRGLPLVLALALPAARRSAKDQRGDSTTHPPGFGYNTWPRMADFETSGRSGYRVFGNHRSNVW